MASFMLATTMFVTSAELPFYSASTECRHTQQTWPVWHLLRRLAKTCTQIEPHSLQSNPAHNRQSEHPLSRREAGPRHCSLVPGLSRGHTVISTTKPAQVLDKGRSGADATSVPYVQLMMDPICWTEAAM
jgi:hypothetical protein